MVTAEMKCNYIRKVYEEMKKRGYESDEIPAIIGKNCFLSALELYPEEQLHDSIQATVDAILELAEKGSSKMDAMRTQTIEMLSYLPDEDIVLVNALVKQLILAWDPDFTNVEEREKIIIEETCMC